MSVRDCIQAKGGTGKLKPKELDLTLDLFDRIRASRAGQAGGEAAEADAARIVAEATRRRAEQYRTQAALQVLVDKRNLEIIDGYNGKLRNAVSALLETDRFESRADIDNVDSVRYYVEAEAHRELREVIEEFRLKGVQIRADRAGQEDWLRAIFDAPVRGVEDGDAGRAKAFADAWRRATARLEERYRRAGGILPDDDPNIYVPNPGHDQHAIARAGRDKWINDIWGKLDREKMLDRETGEPLSDGRLQLLLEEVYETLSTGGLNKLDGAPRRKRQLARRHERARVLRFKDADSWIDYNDTYGNRDIFATLIGHVNRTARDIGLLEVLGPNPDAAIARFSDLVRQEGRDFTGARVIDKTYQILSGSDPVQGSGTAANWGAAVRAWLTGQQLGSALLTATSDFGFITHTARWNGLSATKAVNNYLSQLNPKDPSARLAAAEMGIVVENALSAANAQGRYVDATGASRFAGQYADFIMRASGLAPHTQAGRAGFSMMVYGEVADNLSRAFGDLDPRFARMLRTYGIDEAAWSRIREVEPYEFRGQKFVVPQDIAQLGGSEAGRIAQALSRAAQRETDRAVPTASARVNALLSLGTDRGTAVGEATRFLTMYKRFPFLIIDNHLSRLFGDGFGPWTDAAGQFARGKYLAGLIAYTTVFGAFALQLNEIANGRDPQPMDTPAFWGGAALKGGALGFFADFLHGTARNTYGRGIVSSLGGPGVGLVEDTLALTGGNIGQAVRGEATNAPREAVRFFERYLLPGTSLWYSKLAMDRLITDQLQKAVDPKAERRFRRLERDRRRDFGQEFFFPPGSAAPDRAPDLSNALGEAAR